MHSRGLVTRPMSPLAVLAGDRAPWQRQKPLSKSMFKRTSPNDNQIASLNIVWTTACAIDLLISIDVKTASDIGCRCIERDLARAVKLDIAVLQDFYIGSCGKLLDF